MSIPNFSHRRAIALGAALLCAAALAAGSARAQSLTVSPGSVASGGLATVSFAAPLAGADGIAGVDLVVTLDPILSVVDNSFSLSGPLADWSFTTGGSGSMLSISVANLAGLPDPDTGGLSAMLFSFSVQAGTGFALAGIQLDTLDSAVGQPGEFQTATLSTQLVVQAPIVPEPVPEPGSMVLVGPGLVALLASRRVLKAR